MGLTKSSVGRSAAKDGVMEKRLSHVAVLAGTPNVGKSSIFNALTGLSQHTGNWTGKTVATAVGHNEREDMTFVDLPGAYSLACHSPEEEVARDFIYNSVADAIVVVCDGLCLERSLVPALQIIERSAKVVVAVNFMDEVRRRGANVDTKKLSAMLGVPVVGVSARSGEGLSRLCKLVREMPQNARLHSVIPYPEKVEAEIKRLSEGGSARWRIVEAWCSDEPMNGELEAAFERIAGSDGDAFRAMLISRPAIVAEGIANDVVTGRNMCGYSRYDRRIDRIVTHPVLSIPIMLLMLAFVFWLTIAGANYPSAMLGRGFDALEAWLYSVSEGILPQTVRDMAICGVLRTLFRVISVMLPPMAIFFPLFTIMEDYGLLGRIAFNLDGAFSRCSACGKQALTMCMGLGCNAAGVVGCRIIDSPRERLIAILTNSFMPCNGRFPILITMSAMLCAGGAFGITGALMMTAVIVVGTAATLAVSKLLSLTLLRGVSGGFTLELPPYRRPQFKKVIVRSILDRTLFVLGRAAAIAAPAGLIIWLFANVDVGGMSVLAHVCGALDPLGRLMGLDGAVLCAFILGFPANEIVLPIVIMCYTASGSLGTDAGIAGILAANGWSTVTYINMMIMTLFHFPCSTTVLTVKKETGSVRYTLLAMVIPTVIGILLCIATASVAAVFV